MKKLNSYFISFFIALFLYVSGINAQTSTTENNSGGLPKFTPRIYLNEGFPAGISSLGTNGDFSAPPFGYTAVNGSYGTGVSLGFGSGYSLCDHFELSLDALYFHGFNHKVNDFYSSTLNESYQSSVHGLYLRPSAMILGDPFNCITPFAELGLNLPVFTMMKTTSTFLYNNNTTIIKRDIMPQFHPGIFGGIGANWKFNDNWGVFGEVQAQVQSFQSKHGEIKKYTENGVDKMNTLTTTYSKQTDYVNSYTFSSNPDQTKPALNIASSYSQSAVNILFGLTYHFGYCASTPPGNNAAVTPPLEVVPPCNCSSISIANNAAGNPTRTLNMVRNYDKATKNYSFKITVSTNVEMKCTATASDKPCEGVFITEIYAGGGTAGLRKILSENCGATNTFNVTATSFYGTSATSAGLDELNANVKINFIMLCNGQMKRISQTMEIMNGDLVNSKWGKWEDIKEEESKSIQKSYEQSSTEYLKK